MTENGEGGPLRRAVTGIVQAITDSARAVSGSFAALVGKSSGSVRAIGVRAQVIYDLAPALIRSFAPWLTDDEVDDVVTRIVDDELHTEGSKWSFVDYPDNRFAIVRRAVRYYIQEQEAYRDSRDHANAVYLRLHASEGVQEAPLSRLYAQEIAAAVECALRDLSPAHWETFCDVRLSGLSLGDAAERLGVSVSLVVSRMSDCNYAVNAVVRAYLEKGSRILPARRPRAQKKPAPVTTGVGP